MAKFLKEIIAILVLLAVVTATTAIYLELRDTENGKQPREDFNGVKKVAFIGDSVSWGINPDLGPMSFARYGWVQMITGNATSSPAPPKAQNLTTLWPGVVWKDFSLPGNTIRYYKEDARMREVFDYAPDLVLFLLGGNDVLNYLRDGALNDTEEAQLKENVENILSKIRYDLPDAKVVVLNYYDLFDGLSDKITQRDILEYRNLSSVTSGSNAMLKNGAKMQDCEYIDIYAHFMHHCYGRYLGDGQIQDPPLVKLPLANFNIHPNTDGYEMIYETVYYELTRLKTV